jgi:hypothetical protein
VLSQAILHIKLVQHWTGSFYDDTSLQKLGLVVQLGHRSPSCPCPGAVQKDFVIVDLSGIHTIDIRFCACHDTIGGSSSHIQLLRFRCFPSTITRPRSGFTFDVLDTFHLLTLQGKVSAYDFYFALLHKTDNTGISHIKVRICRALVYMTDTSRLIRIAIDNSSLSSVSGATSNH